MKKVTLGVTIFVFAVLAAIGLVMDCGLDAGRFTAWGTYLVGAGTVVLAIAALFTGVHAVDEYRLRTRTERAKWLFELYGKFYEHNDYKKIRQKIDFEDVEEILGLIRRENGKQTATFSAGERTTLDQFTDYLNFFEMIAWLWKEGQLGEKDVLAMFQYYLERLVNIDKGSEIRNYIKKQGFENLDGLLVECVLEKKRGRHRQKS